MEMLDTGSVQESTGCLGRDSEFLCRLGRSGDVGEQAESRLPSGEVVVLVAVGSIQQPNRRLGPAALLLLAHPVPEDRLDQPVNAGAVRLDPEQ
jgi:hypothetical protein